MARVYTEPINEEPPRILSGAPLKLSRPHEEVQVVSHFICHDLRARPPHPRIRSTLHEEAYAHLDNTNRHYLDTILSPRKQFRP
jgi:hypothetical protein